VTCRTSWIIVVKFGKGVVEVLAGKIVNLLFRFPIETFGAFGNVFFFNQSKLHAMYNIT